MNFVYIPSNIVLINVNELLVIDKTYYDFERLFDNIDVDKYSGFFNNLKSIKRSELINFISFFGGSALIIADNKFLIKLSYFLGLFKNEALILLFMSEISIDELYNILSCGFVSYNSLYYLVNKINSKFVLEIYRLFLLFRKKEIKNHMKMSFDFFKNLIITSVFLFDTVDNSDPYKYYKYLSFDNFYQKSFNINFIRQYYYSNYFFKNFFHERKSFIDIVKKLILNLVKGLYNLLLINVNYQYTFDLNNNYYKFFLLKRSNQFVGFMSNKIKYNSINLKYIYYYIFHEFLSILRLFVFFLIKNSNRLKINRKFSKRFFNKFESKFFFFFSFVESLFISKIGFNGKDLIDLLYKLYFYFKNSLFFLFASKRDRYLVELKIFLSKLMIKFNFFFMFYIQKIRVINLLNVFQQKVDNFIFNFSEYFLYCFTKYFNYRRFDLTSSLFDFHQLNLIKLSNNFILRLLQHGKLSFKNKFFINLFFNGDLLSLIKENFFYFLTKRTLFFYSFKEKNKEFFFYNKMYFKALYNYNLFLYNIYYFNKPLHLVLVEKLFNNNFSYFYTPFFMRIFSTIEFFFDLLSEEIILEGTEDFEHDIFISESYYDNYLETTDLEDLGDLLEIYDREDTLFFEDVNVFDYFDELSSISYYTMESFINKYLNYTGLKNTETKIGVSYEFDYYNSISPYNVKQMNFNKIKMEPLSWYLWTHNSLMIDLMAFKNNYYEININWLSSFLQTKKERVKKENNKYGNNLNKILKAERKEKINKVIRNPIKYIFTSLIIISINIIDFLIEFFVEDDEDLEEKKSAPSRVGKITLDKLFPMRPKKNVVTFKEDFFAKVAYYRKEEDYSSLLRKYRFFFLKRKKNLRNFRFLLEVFGKFKYDIFKIKRKVETIDDFLKVKGTLNTYFFYFDELYNEAKKRTLKIYKKRVKKIDYMEDKTYFEYNIYNKPVESMFPLFELMNPTLIGDLTDKMKSFVLLNEAWVWWDILKKSNNSQKLVELIVPETMEEFLFMNLFVLSGLSKKMKKYDFISSEDYVNYYNRVDFFLDSLLENMEQVFSMDSSSYYDKKSFKFISTDLNNIKNTSENSLINENYMNWLLQNNQVFFYFDYGEILTKLLVFDQMMDVVNTIGFELKDAVDEDSFRKKMVESISLGLVNENLLRKKDKNRLPIVLYQFDLKMQKVLNMFIKDSMVSLYKNYYMYDSKGKLKHFWNQICLVLNESLYYKLLNFDEEQIDEEEDELDVQYGIDPLVVFNRNVMEIDLAALITYYGVIDTLEIMQMYDHTYNSLYNKASQFMFKGLTDPTMLLVNGLKMDFTLGEFFSYDLYLNQMDYYTPVYNYDYYADDQSVNQLKLYDSYDGFRDYFIDEVEVGYEDTTSEFHKNSAYDRIERVFGSSGFVFSEKNVSFNSVSLANYKLTMSNSDYIDSFILYGKYNNIILNNLESFLYSTDIYDLLKTNKNFGTVTKKINSFVKSIVVNNFLYDYNYILFVKLSYCFIHNFKLKDIITMKFKHINVKYKTYYQVLYQIYFAYFLIIYKMNIPVKLKNLLILVYNSYFYYLILSLFKNENESKNKVKEYINLFYLQLLKKCIYDDLIIKNLMKRLGSFIYFFVKSLYLFKYKFLFLVKYKKLIRWSLQKNVMTFIFKLFNVDRYKSALGFSENFTRIIYSNKNFVSDFNKFLSFMPIYLKKYTNFFNEYNINLDDFVLYYIQNIINDTSSLELKNIHYKNKLIFKNYNESFFLETMLKYKNIGSVSLYDYVEYSDNDLDIFYFDDNELDEMEDNYEETDEWAYSYTGFAVGDVSEELVEFDKEADSDEFDTLQDMTYDSTDFDFLFDLDEDPYASDDEENVFFNRYDSEDDYTRIPLKSSINRVDFIFDNFVYKNLYYLRTFLLNILKTYRKKTLMARINMFQNGNRFIGFKNKWIDEKGFSDFNTKIDLKSFFKNNSVIGFEKLTNSIFEKLIVKYTYVSNFLDFFDYLNDLSFENFEFDDDYFGGFSNNLVGFNAKTLYNNFYIELYNELYFAKLFDMYKYFLLSFNVLNFVDSNLKKYNSYIYFFFEFKISFLKNLNYIYKNYRYMNYKVIKFIFNKTYSFSIIELKRVRTFSKLYTSINNKELMLKNFFFEKYPMEFFIPEYDFIKVKEIIDYLFYLDNLVLYNVINLFNLIKQVFVLKSFFGAELSFLSYFFLLKYFKIYLYFNNVVMLRSMDDLRVYLKELFLKFKGFELFLLKNSYNMVQIFYKYGLIEILYYLKSKELSVDVSVVSLYTPKLVSFLVLLYQIMWLLMLVVLLINLFVQWYISFFDILWTYHVYVMDEAKVNSRPMFTSSYFDYLFINWGFNGPQIADSGEIISEPWFFF